MTAARNEIRSLIIARNDLATYLHRRMNLSETLLSLPSLRDISTQAVQAEIIDLEDLHLLLPAPIDDTRGCARCFLVDHCMLFRRVSSFHFYHVCCTDGSVESGRGHQNI